MRAKDLRPGMRVLWRPGTGPTTLPATVLEVGTAPHYDMCARASVFFPTGGHRIVVDGGKEYALPPYGVRRLSPVPPE